MRKTERKLEKKRKNEGGSNGENLREWEKKRNCPFDAKKVCPVTLIKQNYPPEEIRADFSLYLVEVLEKFKKDGKISYFFKNYML